jgi:hypothetical protein
MATSQGLLRLGLVLSSLGLTALALWSSPQPAWVLGGALVLLTALAARRPESLALPGLLVAHVVHWYTVVGSPDATGGWVRLLLAAWLLLLVHVCASAAAVWPPEAPLPRAAVGRWGRRTAAVAALTVPVWGIAALGSSQRPVGEVVLTFAAIAALVLLGGAAHLLSREGAARG